MATKSNLLKSFFYLNIRNDMGLFSNIYCILDKIEEDRNLELMTSLLRQIFQQEIVFTINGFLMRVEKTKGGNSQFGHSKPIGHQYHDFQGKLQTDMSISQLIQ